MVGLIKEVIPKSWFKTGVLSRTDAANQHPPQDWLERLWVYLRRQHPTLESFRDLPILPLGEDKVVPLTLPSLVILRSEFGVELRPGLCHCLELVGVTVVDGLADHVRCHAAVVGSLVRPPTPKGVVDVILTADRQNDVTTVFRDHTTESEKLELLALVGNMSRQSIDVKQKRFLRTLPLFKSTRSTPEQPRFVSAAEVKKAHASHSIVTLMETFIDVSTSEAMSAATTLGVEILNDVSFIKCHVLPEMTNSCLKPDDVQKCMHYVFDNIQMLQRDDPQLLRHLTDIPFVTTKGGQVVSPNSVFDPTDGTLRKLFVGEDNHFPGGFYDTPESLVILRKMGMKTSRDVSAHDILYTAAQIETMSNTLADDTRRQKAETLLMFLASKCDLLQEEVNGKRLIDLLKDLPLVPLLPRPRNFPLTWKNDEYGYTALLPPSVIYPREHLRLVSAVHPIADDKNMEKEVLEFLGLVRKKPSLDDVIRQFDHMLDMQLLTLGDAEYDSFQSACSSIYSFLQQVTVGSKSESSDGACLVKLILSSRPCILVQRQFQLPHSVTFNGGFGCEPYLHNSLPKEMSRRYESLMKLLGVRNTFETSDYVGAIQEMKKHEGDAELTGSELDLAVKLATHLCTSMKLEKDKLDDVKNEHGAIYLPNTRGVLHPINALCYNDNPIRTNDVDTTTLVETYNTNAVGGYTHPTLSREVAIGLGVRTMEREMLSNCAQGIPFGQKQDLTTSLSRILGSYPLNYEILKELIQNADDAGATEIHFVSDSRHHSNTAVFSPSWKPLQGPALCVYNNRPFTEADLEGIQKLGQGSKVHDPSKTGQYGIGFSAMYHLTDTPSVLTRPERKSQSLCVFDPNLSYVPDATFVNPGMRYDVDRLQQRYPDVFSCYLPECFDINDATLFRFPLRTAEMAKVSQISKRSVTPENLQRLLDELKEEACETLLFTTHITKISISEVDHDTGKLNNTYMARAKLSKKHKKLKSELAAASRTVASAEHGDRLRNMPFREVMSTLLLNDTKGVEEKWCVSEQLGTDPDVAVPESLSGAIQAGELRLLPRGGVACLVESYHGDKITQARKKRSVFCFLPLPIATNLPVHINGHFALGYENRRTLWDKADRDSYKTEWNEFLCREVIAPCYVRLMTIVRTKFLKADVDEDNCMKLSRPRHELDNAIAAHQSQLPSFDDKQPDWDVLVQAVYDCCARNKAPIFPSLRQQEDTPNKWCITWLPAIGSGEQIPFFSERQKLQDVKHTSASSLFGIYNPTHGPYGVTHPLAKKTHTKIRLVPQDVLVTCGMKLIIAETVLIESLKRADLPIEVLSPQSLMSFFASYSNDSPLCELGELPMPLKQSAFKTPDMLESVLKYCRQDPEFVSRLDGAPLLLTADNVLRVFDSDKPVYHSSYVDLVPHCKDLFLHDSMRLGVFTDDSFRDTPVLSSLTIDDLVKVLDKELPAKLHNARCHVTWPQKVNTLPRETWLSRLWDFIESQMKNDEGQLSKDRSFVEARLSPLNEWCLIPAYVNGKRFLVPISMASTVIYIGFGQQLYDVLHKMCLPKLDFLPHVTMATSPYGSMKTDILKVLVATIDEPHRILGVVHRHVDITQDQSECLLKYFSDGLEDLEENDKKYVNHLKDLPMYTTVCGHVISLADSRAYTLPTGIPKDGVDAWRSKSNIVFLWQDEEFNELYKAIGCASLTHGNVYCDFLFKHFEYLSDANRWVHLEYIYTNFMQTPPLRHSAISNTDRVNVVSDLRSLPIIDGSPDGDLQPVSYFYDPNNTIFRVMLPKHKLLSQPRNYLFLPREWEEFLNQLGLQRNITEHMFHEFVKEVAKNGAINSNDKNTATKSRILVKHMFSMEDTDTQRSIMQSIADVAFVLEARVDPSLQQLHPQRAAGRRYIAFRNSISTKHITSTWTQAKLLPNWADPDRHFFKPQRAADVKKCLGVADKPPTETVAMHLRALCMETTSNNNNKRTVFRNIYSHLQSHGLEDPDVQDVLSNTPFVLVEDGKVVFANQTVINMYDTDEIRPYLYKLPLYLGEFGPLFQALGATERATADQYCNVLTHLHTRARNGELNPNEYLCAKKAMAGLFQALKAGVLSPDKIVFLLSDAKALVHSKRLVFNDAPAYYERAGALPGLQFMARVQECGESRPEESLCKLSAALQPKMLSSVVSERLTSQCQVSESTDSLAARLSTRLRSPVFLCAIDRLARHEAHRRGIEPDAARIDDATDRLSTINVHGVVGDVVTELVYRDKPVVGSQLKKTCFVGKPNQLEHDSQWHIYVSSDAELTLDLLVPLAGVINDTMSSLLRDAVLYLQPIISCQSEDDINTTLNNHNVREHLTIDESGWNLQPGDPIPETQMAWLKAGERAFDEGEYVGYKEDDSHPVLYGVIKGQRASPSDSSTFLVTIGKNSNVIADDDQLYKFMRN